MTRPMPTLLNVTILLALCVFGVVAGLVLIPRQHEPRFDPWRVYGSPARVDGARPVATNDPGLRAARVAFGFRLPDGETGSVAVWPSARAARDSITAARALARVLGSRSITERHGNLVIYWDARPGALGRAYSHDLQETSR